MRDAFHAVRSNGFTNLLSGDKVSKFTAPAHLLHTNLFWVLFFMIPTELSSPI